MSKSNLMPAQCSSSKNNSSYSSPLFSALLKLVNDSESQSELEEGFIEIAKLLLLQTTLKIAGKPYQLMDVEFYFYNVDIHPDPYSHSFQYANSVRKKQSVIGAWYFHRFTGMAKYTHTRRGFDLTYGDGDRQRYGGILIRAMKSLEDERIITGPSRVVGELITAMDNAVELERIAFDMQAGLAFDRNSWLHLESQALPHKLSIYSAPRFGLSDKAPTYQTKHYRFFTDPAILKKNNDVKKIDFPNF